MAEGWAEGGKLGVKLPAGVEEGLAVPEAVGRTWVWVGVALRVEAVVCVADPVGVAVRVRVKLGVWVKLRVLLREGLA